ncbi:MAG TPA: Spy/CpxP family protein refolding chaperone [Candidatus Binatia bacterium]|nr:Spy/CpxP family protein refolding chaperone [Candidatus Binatia bacterium]
MGKFQVPVFGTTVLALSMISATLSPMAAHGQSGTGEPGSGRPRMHRMMGIQAPWISIALRHQSDLNLSPDQVATLEKIRTDYRDQTTSIREQLRAVEGELATVLENTPANLIEAKAKIEQAEKFRSELRYLRVEALENGKSVLTAEQRDQLKNLVSSRRGFRKHQRQPS